MFESVDEVQQRFRNARYIASRRIATVVFLAARMGRPVLIEGPAGVGKTELAKTLSEITGRPLIRLQCYEGLDEGKALYEWKYAKQLLYTQLLRERIGELIADAPSLPEAVARIAGQDDAFFSHRFLSPRPLLGAIQSEEPVVLLVDEIDKAEPEFEAFLLEVLSDFQVSVPELGTVRARHIPLVVLTSNNARELSDGLKRRCLHLFIDFPMPAEELEIIRMKVPEIPEKLARAVVMPVALAGILTFLLTPLVIRLERLGFRRIPSALCAGLLAVGFAWLLERSVERPGRQRLVALGAVAAAGALTHYFFLLTIAAGLLWLWTSGAAAAARRRVSVALALALVPFLAWLPGLVEQSEDSRLDWVASFSVPKAAYLYSTLFASAGPLYVEEHPVDIDPVEALGRIAVLAGSARAILTGERVALNLLGRLSGRSSRADVRGADLDALHHEAGGRQRPGGARRRRAKHGLVRRHDHWRRRLRVAPWSRRCRHRRLRVRRRRALRQRHARRDARHRAARLDHLHPARGAPAMKTIPSALQADLQEGTTTLAWCWRIARSDGTTFGFTDHDQPLHFEGTMFEPESGFTASELRSSSDLSVDAEDAEGVLRSHRITETDILDGRWDNAEVEVWRVNWSDPSQRVLLRRGAIGQIRRGRLAFVAEVRSLAHVLGQTVGRTFQATCDAQLGDARCGVDLDDPSYMAHGAVSAILRDRAFVTTGLGGFATGWFTLGTLTWTSGANVARRAEVAGHAREAHEVTISLLEAPVRHMTVGDTFIIRAGCDKQLETCRAKFANVANFRGFPHIPGQDTVIRYATKDGGHEGAVL